MSALLLSSPPSLPFSWASAHASEHVAACLLLSGGAEVMWTGIMGQTNASCLLPYQILRQSGASFFGLENVIIRHLVRIFHSCPTRNFHTFSWRRQGPQYTLKRGKAKGFMWVGNKPQEVWQGPWMDWIGQRQFKHQLKQWPVLQAGVLEFPPEHIPPQKSFLA